MQHPQVTKVAIGLDLKIQSMTKDSMPSSQMRSSITPVKSFVLPSKSTREVILPTSEGTVPLNLLIDTNISLIFVNNPTSVGSVPVIVLLRRWSDSNVAIVIVSEAIRGNASKKGQVSQTFHDELTENTDNEGSTIQSKLVRSRLHQTKPNQTKPNSMTYSGW